MANNNNTTTTYRVYRAEATEGTAIYAIPAYTPSSPDEAGPKVVVREYHRKAVRATGRVKVEGAVKGQVEVTTTAADLKAKGVTVLARPNSRTKKAAKANFGKNMEQFTKAHFA